MSVHYQVYNYYNTIIIINICIMITTTCQIYFIDLGIRDIIMRIGFLIDKIKEVSVEEELTALCN